MFFCEVKKLHKNRLSIVIVLALLLIVCVSAVGCDVSHTHNYNSVPKYDAASHWNECSCGAKINKQPHDFGDWQTDKQPTQTTSGLRHADCKVCAYSKSEIIPPLSESQDDREVDFYAINDFHGKVDRMSTVSGYLAERRNANANTVFINSGDMFQGSMESNSNYGTLLSECMDDVGFDAFTFGNHEFDWGLENLIALANKSGVPFLGANIYHWDAATKTFGTFADELAQEYVVKTLSNGLKIGIIGIIGKDQITSISSQLVQTIGFKDPADVIPQLSRKLKTELNCDVVVVSAHTGAETLLYSSKFDITEYCDAVFCAHTHKQEVETKNGVPFIQGGSYGSYVSHVKLKVSSSGEVSCTLQKNERYSDSWPNKFSVSELIDNSNEQIAEEANRVLATANGYLSRNGEMPRIVCNAIADYAAEHYADYPIALAMVNIARNDVYAGEITYSELYNAVPFDNTVYIAKVSGHDILNEANYGNYVWRVSEKAICDSDHEYYYIAVIDYLLFHQNSAREYNYFRSAFESGFTPIALENSNYDDGMYNYRLITRDWLLGKQQNGNTIDVSLYSGSNANTNIDLLTHKVSFGGGSGCDDDKLSHNGTLSDPYTAADAAILAKGVTSASEAREGYLKATVSNIMDVVFSNLDGAVRNVSISDKHGNTVQLYFIHKFQGATLVDNWNQADFELKEGDEVVLYGKFITYNQIVEITQGYCVSINGASTGKFE